MNKIVELNWTGEDSTLDEYASILLCARPARMRNPNRGTCVVAGGTSGILLFVLCWMLMMSWSL